MIDTYEIVSVQADTAAVADRWRTARHECRHLVTAAALGVKPLGAFLLSGGGGAAYHGEATAWEGTCIAVAGLVDEVAAEPPAPAIDPEREPGDKPAADTPPAEVTLTLPVCVVDPCDMRGEADHQTLARWVMRHDSDWTRWTQRAQDIVNSAKRLLALNRHHVERLAQVLYRKGFLDGADLEGLVAPQVYVPCTKGSSDDEHSKSSDGINRPSQGGSDGRDAGEVSRCVVAR